MAGELFEVTGGEPDLFSPLKQQWVTAVCLSPSTRLMGSGRCGVWGTTGAACSVHVNTHVVINWWDRCSQPIKECGLL